MIVSLILFILLLVLAIYGIFKPSGKILAIIFSIALVAFVLETYFIVTASAEIHDGAIGRIQIPSIRADFDLVWTAKETDAHQHNALLYKRQGCLRIGNHYGSSGTWKLENVKVGDKAYLEYITQDGFKTVHHSYDYVCYAVMLLDVKNMEFSHKGIEYRPFEETDLICCTCVWSDSTRNYVAVFEMVK